MTTLNAFRQKKIIDAMHLSTGLIKNKKISFAIFSSQLMCLQ